MDNADLDKALDGLERQSLGADEGGRLALHAPGIAARAAEPDAHTLHPASAARRQPATPDAISTFLDTYGHGQSAEEDALIERLIFNPTPDYAAYLEETEPAATAPAADAAADPQLDAINRFLATAPGRFELEEDEATASPAAPQPIQGGAEMPPDASAPLGESMARLLAAQGRWAKAREALTQLNLQNPGKNRYFALQIDFLDRLLANEERLAKARAAAKRNR